MKNDVHVSPANLYLPADCYLLRAPALSAHTFQRLCISQMREPLDTADGDAWFQIHRTAAYQLLLDISSHPQVEQALAIASSSLHERLRQVHREEVHPSRARKLFSGLLRYLIRMSTRPTPFGLFSGVALGSFGEKVGGYLGSPTLVHFRTRPDMQWFLSVLKRLENAPALVTQLSVQTNQLAYFAGGRVYLPPADPYGQKQDQLVSLRATPVVRQALELAQTPLPYPALRDALLQAFPNAPSEQVGRLLWQLWEHDVLLSTLHPPLTVAQPAQYFLHQLEPLQGVEERRDLLGEILATSATFDAGGIGGSLAPLATLAHLQHTLLPETPPHPQIQVDSLLSVSSPTLPASVGSVAAHAAELLLRFTPFPHGSPALQEYRQQFLEKYGAHAEVPLLELLSPELGLDAPVGYNQPPRVASARISPPRPLHEPRERLLQMLVQEALNSHEIEVVLQEEHLATLETWQLDLAQAPRSLEIYIQIQAASREALDRGRFCVVVSPNPGSTGAGRSFGRFFDLLGEPGIRALRDVLLCEEALEPETIFAELSYQHRSARTSNVAIRPGLRTYEIAVGVAPSVPSDNVILFEDLVVGVQDNRFYLRSLRFNKHVVVSQLHMLNSAQAPNVCRFLLDVASDGFPLLASFDWGSLPSAPFLPRVTVPSTPGASIVLSPARWHLQPNTLQPLGSGSLETRRFVGLQTWRTHWRVPRYVYLTQADHRLLLDLEHPLMAAELFANLATLQKGQQVVLQELLPNFEHLWLTDIQGAPFFSEVVVPLLRRERDETYPSPVSQTPSFAHQQLSFSQADPLRSHVAMQQTRTFFPGDAWSYIKLFCTPTQQDEIIAGPLREVVRLLRKEQVIDRWFFLRYADPQPHLRLRIHSGTREQIQPALSMLLSWSRQLATRGRIQRFSLETYEREVARYGGPMAIDLLEQVFCLDSDLCSSLVSVHYTHHLTLDPLAAAVVSLDRLFSAWGYGRERRFQWLQQRVEKYAFRKEFRAERRRYSALFTFSQEKDATPEFMAQYALLNEIIAPLEDQLPALATQIRDLAQKDQLWVTEDELLASVAHMHKIRLLDLNRQKEHQLYAFWHHTLESIRQKEKVSEKESD